MVDRNWLECILDSRTTSESDAEALEAALGSRSPDEELYSRVRLIGYCWFQNDRESDHKRIEHTSWLIDHHPEIDLRPYTSIFLLASDVVLDSLLSKVEAKRKAVPTNTDILRREIDLRYLQDPTTCDELIGHGISLEPENSFWYRRRGELCRDHPGKFSPSHGIDAYSKACLRSTTLLERVNYASELARLSVSCQPSVAATNAHQVLVDISNLEDESRVLHARHYAHIVLGHLSLQAGDVPRAVECLRLASSQNGDAAMRTYGPDLELAAQLVERGQRSAVVDYLTECIRISPGLAPMFREWVRKIESGIAVNLTTKAVYDLPI